MGGLKPKPKAQPRKSSLQAAAASKAAPSAGGDAPLFASIDQAIKDGQQAVLERDNIFGAMGDEDMGEEGEQKKRSRGDTLSIQDPQGNDKNFWISKWRVDEVITQIGGDYATWINECVAPGGRQAEVNRFLAAQMEGLESDQQREIRCLPLEEQIPALHLMVQQQEEVRAMEEAMATGEEVNDSFELEEDNENPGGLY